MASNTWHIKGISPQGKPSKYRRPAASAGALTNLGFSEWGGVFGAIELTTALRDRLTQHCHILETGDDSFRFRASTATPRPEKNITATRPT